MILLYEGIFFEGEDAKTIKSLEEKKLPIRSDILHCTFKYLPKKDEIFNQLVGKEFDVFLTGYACDGRNSGFSVQFTGDIDDYYINFEETDSSKLKRPHVTTSIAPGSKPMNTKDLDFVQFEKPVKVKGKFGYWVKEGYKQFLMYKEFRGTNE